MRPSLEQNLRERSSSASSAQDTSTALFLDVDGHQSEDKVARAVQLSAEKYCSASIMLGQVADVTHGFEVAE